MEHKFLDGRLTVKVGDITIEAVDAIVNAANETLLGGGGVDGAIHRKGGPAIREECLSIREERFPDGLPTGQAVITTGGDLPARYVIHTVGPIYGRNAGRDADLLANCYRNSIRLAAEHDISSVAFPAISTGVYGYPKAAAAEVASETIRRELSLLDPVFTVRLVFFSEQDEAAFLRSARL